MSVPPSLFFSISIAGNAGFYNGTPQQNQREEIQWLGRWRCLPNLPASRSLLSPASTRTWWISLVCCHLQFYGTDVYTSTGSDKTVRRFRVTACWTSRGWCWPCQTSGHFFAFSLVFGLILRFFYTSDSNFYPRAWRTKSRFCSLCVPCVSLPRATQDNSRERNLVAVLVFTSKLNLDTEDSRMEKYIFDQSNGH